MAPTYRYLNNSSSRQGEQREGWPGSRCHGWQSWITQTNL